MDYRVAIFEEELWRIIKKNHQMGFRGKELADISLFDLSEWERDDWPNDARCKPVLGLSQADKLVARFEGWLKEQA